MPCPTNARLRRRSSVELYLRQIAYRRPAAAAAPWPAAATRVARQLVPALGGVLVLLVFWYALAVGRPDVPGPLPTLAVLWSLLSDPFYYRGPNDQGIGVQIVGSLGRVFV